jgi:hypothetical protein
MDKNEFLEKYEAFVTANYVSGGLPASRLGALWPRWREVNNLPEPVEIGYQKHGQILTDLAYTGRWVLAHSGTPSLTIVQKDDTLSAVAGMRPSDGHTNTKVRRLKSDVWRAFTFEAPGQTHLYVPPSTVLFGVSSQQIEKSAGYPITPVPRDQQQLWLRNFADLHKTIDLDAIEKALNATPWFIHVQKYLSSLIPPLTEEWNHFRAEHIFNEVMKWQQEHGVPDTIFDVPTPDAGSASTTCSEPQESGSLRDLVHRIVEQMSPPELLTMRVPLYAIIDLIRRYLREAYDGAPYATKYLFEEAFASEDGVAFIDAATLRWRLPATLRLAEERERTLYQSTAEEIEPILHSYTAFVELCERMEKQTGKPVRIVTWY